MSLCRGRRFLLHFPRMLDQLLLPKRTIFLGFVATADSKIRFHLLSFATSKFLSLSASIASIVLGCRNENLNITFLDDEIMIARSGNGDVFLWLRG